MPDIDGVSLAPLITGHAETRGAPAIMTWLKGNHSLRSEQWRYTRYRDGSDELYDQSNDPYDQSNDPYEWTNLANDARFADVLSKLRKHIPA